MGYEGRWGENWYSCTGRPRSSSAGSWSRPSSSHASQHASTVQHGWGTSEQHILILSRTRTGHTPQRKKKKPAQHCWMQSPQSASRSRDARTVAWSSCPAQYPARPFVQLLRRSDAVSRQAACGRSYASRVSLQKRTSVHRTVRAGARRVNTTAPSSARTDTIATASA